MFSLEAHAASAAYEDLWLGSRLWDVGELGGFGVWGEGLRCWGFVIS